MIRNAMFYLNQNKPSVFDTVRVCAELCRERGIVVKTMEWHCIEKGNRLDQLVLGFGHLEPDAIERGIRLL